MSKSVYEVGRPATFFWREETHGKHIESAAAKILARLGERYDLNQFLIDNLTTEIEQRLKRAERGEAAAHPGGKENRGPGGWYNFRD